MLFPKHDLPAIRRGTDANIRRQGAMGLDKLPLQQNNYWRWGHRHLPLLAQLVEEVPELGVAQVRAQVRAPVRHL